METNRALFLALVLALLAIFDCSLADLEVNKNANNGLDSQLKGTDSSKKKADVSSLGSDSVGVDNGNKNGGDQLNKSKPGMGDVDVNKNDSGSQSRSQKKDNAENGKGELDEKLPIEVKDEPKKEESSSDGTESKEVPKKKSNEGNSGIHLNQPRKEGSHVDECDPLNKCMDEEKKLVACLRVPGNESPKSPAFSLLIRNKGKGPLNVTISTPDFVRLKKTKIQLQEKEDKEVEMSILSGGSETLIVLTSRNGRCNLDIGNLIAHYFGKQLDSSHTSSYINLRFRTPTIAIISFAALLTLASVWMCISFRRKQFSKNGSKYQKLDMELPLSGVGAGKLESEVNDGWDNNWGDDWDDEEAPKTPSMPVTPGLSSKGLASRRLNKEGWKD